MSRYLIPVRAGNVAVGVRGLMAGQVPWLHSAFDDVAGWISSESDVTLATQCDQAPSTDAFCTVLAVGCGVLRRSSVQWGS